MITHSPQFNDFNGCGHRDGVNEVCPLQHFGAGECLDDRPGQSIVQCRPLVNRIMMRPFSPESLITDTQGSVTALQHE